MNLRNLIVAAPLLALPATAFAQPVPFQPISGVYVGAGAGVNFLQNQTIKSFQGPLGIGSPGGINPKFAGGPVFYGEVGYGFGNGLRVELELNYTNNSLRSASDIAGQAKGTEAKYGGLVNVIYDIDVAPWGIPVVVPYVGLGIGVARNNWNNVTITGAGPNGLGVGVNTGVTGWAAQAIAGLAFPLDQALPGLAFTIDYRFMSMPEQRKYTAGITGPAGNTLARSKLKVADDFNNMITIGLRYALNAAPPPPPPAPAPVAAPAPAPSRTYLVFFDWDKADLTDRARQIIAEAAMNSTRVQVTRIEVNGYTDLSGTAAYNQKLSERRARAVAAELVKNGVPQNEIVARGFGESNPLVPTAQGVREPQNRRVEIILK